MGISGGNRLVAFTRIIRPVCGDTADVLINRDLVQKLWQHGSITDVAAGDFDGPNLECFLVDTYVYLTPNTPFSPAMLAGIPFAFSLGLDSLVPNVLVKTSKKRTLILPVVRLLVALTGRESALHGSTLIADLESK